MKARTTAPKMPKSSTDVEPLSKAERDAMEAAFPGSTAPTRPRWTKAHEEALQRAKAGKP